MALTVVIGGCISVLPKSPPVQLYTFGQRPPPLAPSPSAALKPSARVAVALTAITLPRAAAGDQILTLTGQQAAYVASARWLTPAVLMFQADAERALETGVGRVRILPRGDAGAAQALLRLDVRNFEARYEQGAGGAPTILVDVRATLSTPGGEPLADETFTAREPAAENRVGEIVGAYDRATSQVLDRAAAWTDAQAADVPPSSRSVTATATETRSTAHQR